MAKYSRHEESMMDEERFDETAHFSERAIQMRWQIVTRFDVRSNSSHSIIQTIRVRGCLKFSY